MSGILNGYKPKSIGNNIIVCDIINRMSKYPLFVYYQKSNIFEIGVMQTSFSLSNKDMYDLFDYGIISFYYNAMGCRCTYKNRPSHWSISKYQIKEYFRTGTLMVNMNGEPMNVSDLPGMTKNKIWSTFRKSYVKINHELLNKYI